MSGWWYAALGTLVAAGAMFLVARIARIRTWLWASLVGLALVPAFAGYGAGGTWIRDTCHALPQGEVCARLVDRRDVIRKRFFNAQERERDDLRREERGINARLAADCWAG